MYLNMQPCTPASSDSANSVHYFMLYIIQATQIRLALSRILEDEQKWRESAEVLCGIPLESGQK